MNQRLLKAISLQGAIKKIAIFILQYKKMQI